MKKFIQSITDFYREMDFLKKVVALLGAGILVQGATILALSFSDQIVILEREGERLGFVGERKSAEVTEKEIKELVRRFIVARCEWKEFTPNLIAGNISPFTKKSLAHKIQKDLTKQAAAMKKSSISQYVGRIKVQIDKERRIIGVFDKIIRIEGVPLLSQAQVLIGITSGSVSEFNKLGLFINKVVEYDSK